MKGITAFLFFVLCLVATVVKAQRYLVKEGSAKATIVIAEGADEATRRAAFDLQYHIRKSSGALLKLEADSGLRLSSDQAYVFIGASRFTDFFAHEITSLKEGEFLIQSKGNKLFVLANAKSKLPVLHYGVSHLLEELVQAKWFFPGDFGTSVTKTPDIPLPDINLTWKPRLQMRIFGHSKDIDDSTRLWLIHHRLGAVDTLNFRHAFEDWHPDLLPYVSIKPFDPKRPKKKQKRVYREHYVKFRLNDRGFREEVVKRWFKSGKPAIYNISLPDGHGYDSTLVPSADPQQLWAGKVDVTAPYLDFCSYLDSAINTAEKQCKFYILSYAAYHQYPKGFEFDGRNFIVSYVSYTLDSADRVNWQWWNSTGATMILRPNWWHKGHFTSYAPYQHQGEFFQFALEHDMEGFFMDILRRQWASQGFQYYLVARLSYAGLDYEDVRREYLSFFGPYAEQVDAYLSRSEWLFFENVVTPEGKHMHTIEDGHFNELEKMYHPEELEKLGDIIQVAKPSTSEDVFFRRMKWLGWGHTMAQSLLDYYDKNAREPSASRTISLIENLREKEKTYPYSFDAEYIVRKYVLPFVHANYSRDSYNEALRAARKHRERKVHKSKDQPMGRENDERE